MNRKKAAALAHRFGVATKVGAKLFKLPKVFLAALLVLANSPCVLACAIKTCHVSEASSKPNHEDHLPPCHRHQPTKPENEPESCVHSPLLAEYRAPVLTAPEVLVLSVAFSPVHNAFLALSEHAQKVIPRETSPPASPELVFSTILRV